ncbi:gdsL-esterase [Caudoviricetes sp.]|nr:gdsL-esterase [Caudoviricetes sp.]
MIRTRNRTRGGGLAVQSLKAADALAKMANGVSTTSGSLTSYVFRMPAIIGDDMSALVVNNFAIYLNSGNVVSAIGNAFTVDKIAIEHSSGVYTPVYFGGSRSTTLASGDFDKNSDDVRPPAPLTKWSRGDVVWIRAQISVTTSGHSFPRISHRTTTGVTGGYYSRFNPAATTITNIDGTSTITYSGTAPTNLGSGYVPILLGRPISSTGKKYVMNARDSIGESAVYTPTDMYGQGYMTRAMTKSGTNPYGAIGWFRTGARNDIIRNDAVYFPAYCKYTNVLNEGFGVNELYRTGSSGVGFDGSTGVSFATLMTNKQTTYTAYKTIVPNGKILLDGFHPTCSGSTDSWATEANQTTYGNWGAGGFSEQLTTQAATWISSGVIDAYCPHTAQRGTDTTKWIVNGSANYATADGVHPSKAAHDLMTAETVTVLDAL